MSSIEFGQCKQIDNDTANIVSADKNSPVEHNVQQLTSNLQISEPIAASSENCSVPLFYEGEATEFQSRWDKIQTGFVDEPRRAVEQADELVVAAMKRLTVIFADERIKLEREWDKGEDVSTEDLRMALRRYRSFFNRLLLV